MQPFPPALQPAQVQLATARTALAVHTLVPPGTVVEARVLSVSVASARQAVYDVLLSIGSEVLKVSTARPLEAGSHVRITSTAGTQLHIAPAAPPGTKVTDATPIPDGTPAAKRVPGAQVSTPANRPAAAVARHSADAPATRSDVLQKIDAQIDQALRSFLPREQPVRQALRSMHQMLTAADKPLPDAAGQLVRDVFARLPDLAALQNPRQLPDALRVSGAVLEHALLQLAGGSARNSLGDDLRVALLRVAANLRARLADTNVSARPATGDREATLLQLVQSVLARMKVHQLSTLNSRLHNQSDTAPAARLSVELPFLHGAQIESVQLRIGRDETGREAAHPVRSPTWTADIDFDLGGLGPLHVRARLHDAHVSTAFWAPHDVTLALVKRNIATLREELARHDIQLRHVSYTQGVAPAPEPHPRPLVNVAI